MSVDDWQREIEQLHDFFVDWFRGRVEDRREVFGRFEAVLAADFSMVIPDGRTVPRATLLQGLRASHGSRPSVEIRIEQPTLILERDGVVVARYREWQRDSEGERARLSTVVFRRNASQPNGLAWVTVHETWMGEGI